MVATMDKDEITDKTLDELEQPLFSTFVVGQDTLQGIAGNIKKSKAIAWSRH